MSQNPHKTRTKSFVLGTIIGTAVGAALGVLYAPKKGKETRKELKEKTEEFKDKAKEAAKEGHQAFLGWSEEAKKAAGEFSKITQENLHEVSESVSEKATAVVKDIKASVESEIKEKDKKPHKPRYFKGIR